MKHLMLATVLFTALTSLARGQTAAPPTLPPPLIDGAAQPLSKHVYYIADRGIVGVPNVGIVVGRNAALVIDAGLGERNGRTVLAEVKRLAPGKKLYLVATHAHPEHDTGFLAFPREATMIRSVAQTQDAELDLDTVRVFSNLSPVMKELLQGASFRKADATFEQERVLKLGGVTVRLIAMGPNHTPGDTAIVIEREGILFGGDIAMSRLPILSSPKSSLDHWLQALSQFEAMKPRIIVPSHGPIGDQAYIDRARRYLTTVRDETARAKQLGKSVDEAVAATSLQLKAAFPDLVPMQMTPAIRAAYAESPQ